LRRFGPMSSWRVVVMGMALVASACFAWPGDSYGGPRAHDGSRPHGGAHLYVLLGFLNMSPGLSEFGSKIGRRGIPTTVSNYVDWPALAQEAIAQYKSGRLRSIYIVGHSLGGSAAKSMAAELGRSGVPVQSVVTLDQVGASEVSSNVRSTVDLVPRKGEDHYSMIAAHDRDLSSYVLGGKRLRDSHAKTRRRNTTTLPGN